MALGDAYDIGYVGDEGLGVVVGVGYGEYVDDGEDGGGRVLTRVLLADCCFTE